MSSRFRMIAALLLALPVSRSLYSQASTNPSPLTVHGYLSQGFAKSDGEQLIGITKDGTTDYRSAAIQFSYAFDAKDAFVLQFANRRMGATPAVAGQSDVTLDWAFYTHTFSNGITSRFGRVHIPFGIYNETRTVGVVLPFYRAPFAFYGDRDWTAEAVDGASFGRTFSLAHDWSIDATVYGGGWDYVESIVTPQIFTVVSRHVDRGVGSQLWLNTPIQGVRVGAGTLNFDVRHSAIGGDTSQTAHMKEWFTSFDASFERFKVQSEYRFAAWSTGNFRAGYVLVGVNPTAKTSVNLQGDFARANLDWVGLPRFDNLNLDDDIAAGFNYHFTSALVGKAEYHWARSLQVQRPINFFLDHAPRARYMILSLATAF